ncbi:sulfotransferase family protein [Nocardioides sp. MAHUQ-72]|uniref:sulfotransferase family protein n=1 Tax=unclassified Nocardioides TaxID=2615069 RepID=UPI00361853CE
MNTLVLITGTGRSGTSTMSGTLHHLGLYVPGPYLGANESNPKGFFESRWSVRFHKRVTQKAHVHEFDGRPEAFDRVQSVLSDEDREAVVRFLRKHAEGHEQIVVKDPRTVWTQALWREAAAEVGLETRYISMLRHPAEVVGSRATYYASSTDQEKRRRYEIFNVARWINNSLISERETRGQSRAFVAYTDLLDDWRPVLVRLSAELGLAYDADLTDGSPSPVDDFIEPGLRRHQVTWQDLEIPADLQDLAQRIWDDLVVLGRSGGHDEAASADLDELSCRYQRLLSEAAAISHDSIGEAVDQARRAGAEEERSRLGTSGATAPARDSRRIVEETGGRELLREVGARVRRRVRRG